MATPTTLYEFYTGIGATLPSIPARAKVYENFGLGSAASYTGTAAQNTALLNLLVKKSETPAPTAVVRTISPLGETWLASMIAQFTLPSTPLRTVGCTATWPSRPQGVCSFSPNAVRPSASVGRRLRLVSVAGRWLRLARDPI